jgi:adenylate cyclase class IV
VHFDNMKRILHMLGYRVAGTYSKNSENFALPGVKISLDELPKVGWFAEIEGTPSAIKRAAQLLGLEPRHHERRSYRRILKEESPLLSA